MVTLSLLVVKSTQQMWDLEILDPTYTKEQIVDGVNNAVYGSFGTIRGSTPYPIGNRTKWEFDLQVGGLLTHDKKPVAKVITIDNQPGDAYEEFALNEPRNDE